MSLSSNSGLDSNTEPDIESELDEYEPKPYGDENTEETYEGET